MKVVVTGGRNYVMTASDYVFLENALSILEATGILTGGARGVDAQVAAWARRRGIPLDTVRPNWTKDGDAAPFRANTRLAEAAGAVIAFPGAEGTADMVDQARRMGLPVHESPGRQLANLPTMDLRFRSITQRGPRP